MLKKLHKDGLTKVSINQSDIFTWFVLCTDEPGAPRPPTAKEQDRDHITVQWEPPGDDGGAPIKGYEVERKEPKTNRWIKVRKEMLCFCLIPLCG